MDDNQFLWPKRAMLGGLFPQASDHLRLLYCPYTSEMLQNHANRVYLPI
jgi:hypothetical protein